MVSIHVPTGVRRFATEEPTAPAVRLLGDTATTTYAELADRIGLTDTLVAQLRPAAGTVAVLAVKSVDSIARILALTHLGYDVALLSPTLGSAAIRRVCAAAECTHLIDAVGRVERLSQPTPDRHPATTGRLILTTSGSTGHPKIVPIPSDGLQRFFRWSTRTFGIVRGTRVLSFAPLNFDVSLLDVWAGLTVGAQILLVPPERAASDRWLAEHLVTEQPEVIQAVPTFFRNVLNTATEPIESTTQILVTGDVFTGSLARGLRERFPHASIHNVYGSTETNDSFLHTLTERDFADDTIAIGRPIADVESYVIDEQGREIDGAGSIGELVVSTPFQTTGYLGSDSTNETFVSRPAEAGRFYRTGDIVARRQDGTLRLLGRNDHIVKVRGVRTNTAEVESLLQEQKNIREAAVVAEADPVEGYRLHAFIVPSGPIDKLALRRDLARALPVTALPAFYHFSSETLPRTTTGKIDRSRLLAPA